MLQVANHFQELETRSPISYKAKQSRYIYSILKKGIAIEGEKIIETS